MVDLYTYINKQLRKKEKMAPCCLCGVAEGPGNTWQSNLSHNSNNYTLFLAKIFTIVPWPEATFLDDATGATWRHANFIFCCFYLLLNTWLSRLPLYWHCLEFFPSTKLQDNYVYWGNSKWAKFQCLVNCSFKPLIEKFFFIERAIC